MKKLEDFDLKNKRVLVRCDFNVPLDDKGTILEDHRIRAMLPTIEYLREQGSKIILLSHLGRPNGKIVKDLSLKPVFLKLKEWFKEDVFFIEDCIGDRVVEKTKELKEGQILLLENVQFYPGEKARNMEYAENLSKNAEFFVLDSFGQSHRDYASITGIQEFLPSSLGKLIYKELDALKKIQEPERPYIAIIGGVKIDSKIGMVKNMFEKSDHVLIGGKIANTLLAIKGLCEADLPPAEVVHAVSHLDLTNTDIHLPLDVMVSPDTSDDSYTREVGPGNVKKDEDIFDIGPTTIEKFSEIIKTAKTIVINGPMGFFEDKRFARGTKEILKAIAENKEAFKVAGGGNTADAIFEFGFEEDFDHISTGGGSMIKLLGGEKLPGIEKFKDED
jgi:3-phosphoglycerate kinase